MHKGMQFLALHQSVHVRYAGTLQRPGYAATLSIWEFLQHPCRRNGTQSTRTQPLWLPSDFAYVILQGLETALPCNVRIACDRAITL